MYMYVYVVFMFFFSESNVYVLKPVRCFSLNSFSYKGSYFKFRGEGSQIFWICLGGLPGRVPFDEVHGVTKDSLSIFHPAPKFVREYETNMLAHNPKCMYHPSCPVNIMHFYINFYVFFGYILYLYMVCFLPRNISVEKNVSVNRFGANRLRKSLIPFHSIWGLCFRYNLFRFLKSKSRKVSFLKVKWNAATLDMFCFWILASLHVVLPFTIGFKKQWPFTKLISILLRIEAGTDLSSVGFGGLDWTQTVDACSASDERFAMSFMWWVQLRWYRDYKWRTNIYIYELFFPPAHYVLTRLGWTSKANDKQEKWCY